MSTAYIVSTNSGAATRRRSLTGQHVPSATFIDGGTHPPTAVCEMT